VALLAFGSMVPVALGSAQLLAALGIHAAVINASTVKPLDQKLLADLAARRLPIVTLEEHALLGGFGEAVAGHCVANGQPAPIALLGIRDEFIPHGSVDRLLALCGLDAEGVARSVEEAVEAHG